MKPNQQLEISLENNTNICRRPYRNRARRLRARWWFDQMRAVVDSATDWKAVHPEGEQHTYLTLDTKNR